MVYIISIDIPSMISNKPEGERLKKSATSLPKTKSIKADRERVAKERSGIGWAKKRSKHQELPNQIQKC